MPLVSLVSLVVTGNLELAVVNLVSLRNNESSLWNRAEGLLCKLQFLFRVLSSVERGRDTTQEVCGETTQQQTFKVFATEVERQVTVGVGTTEETKSSFSSHCQRQC